MRTSALILLLQLAGVLHLGLLAAGGTMSKAVQIREATATLPPFLRRLFFVYMGFIGLVLAGFGSLTFLFAGEMAGGEPLARGLCFLCAAFWGLRLLVAIFVFDVRPYLTSRLYRLGYWATNVVFVYLLVVYSVAAWQGGSP
jgi:hypothetical protein